MISTQVVLTLACVLFGIGTLGVLFRRNAIVVFMCIELMLNAVNLSFIAFARSWGDVHGQIAVFFVMVVAAAEAAVGLAIIISVFRATQSIETTDQSELRA